MIKFISSIIDVAGYDKGMRSDVQRDGICSAEHLARSLDKDES